MTRALPFLLPLSLLTGCFFYDTTGACGRGDGDCGWGDEPDANGDTSGLEDGDTADGTDDTADTGEDATEAHFRLDPDEATGGTTIIASLTATDFDLTTVTGVKAYGSVTLLASSARTNELLLSLKIDKAAVEGDTVDLLLEVGDDAEYLPAILKLHAAADDGGDTDTGGCP